MTYKFEMATTAVSKTVRTVSVFRKSFRNLLCFALLDWPLVRPMFVTRPLQQQQQQLLLLIIGLNDNHKSHSRFFAENLFSEAV